MSDTRVSRRNILKGAAATAGTAALASCGADNYDASASGMYVPRVHEVPVDPDAVAWRSAPEILVALGPQNVALPQKTTAGVTSLFVRSLHDGTRIGFRLEWDDPDVNDLTIRVDDFRDACAVLLAPGRAVALLRTMGSATVPATLLHWKADWQRDVERGRQGLEAAYPNRSIDVYPPLWNVAPGDVTIESYKKAGATEWLPGYDVGNPTSADGRTTPVEKILAYGFSTATSMGTQDALGHGVRTPTGWRVTLLKPIGAADAGEIALQPGATCTCAFAVWSGAVHDGGSRKSPSLTVHALTLAA